MTKVQAIVMKPDDNVATVVEAIAAGSDVAVERGGETFTVRVTDSLPFAHKFALQAIAKGETIKKYGEPIGLATADISPGQHVHVHNLGSSRGRGDKKQD